jgi:hypothetical protein
VLDNKQRYVSHRTVRLFLQNAAGRCVPLNGPFVKCSGVLTDFCLARFVGRLMRLHRASGLVKNSIRASREADYCDRKQLCVLPETLKCADWVFVKC